MDLFSIFKGGKYFDKHIQPKCDYCQFGRRAKDGEKVICEKRGLVQRNDSCFKFVYSPLKRIPVKQLNFVGSLADEDIYTESASDIEEKQKELLKDTPPKDDSKKTVEEKAEETTVEPENAVKESSDTVADETVNVVETVEEAVSADKVAEEIADAEESTENTAE
ncbi:MAG: hypothetical protein K2N27_03015 [Ruminococcus sp.]|nr:hypothetical protein [Ruminococcus sp.]